MDIQHNHLWPKLVLYVPLLAAAGGVAAQRAAEPAL